MKKVYQKPTTNVVRIEQSKMLCLSDINSGDANISLFPDPISEWGR